MTVTHLEFTRRAPFASGAAFGDVGPYERIDGVLQCAVDPADPANATIVDLDHAERSPDGRVHFRADLCLLQPADLSRASGRLLLEVPNRGRKGALGRFNRPAAPGQVYRDTEGIDVGDGLLLRLGWSVAWCGWQWDVIRGQAPHGLVGFDAPQALGADGQPIRGRMMLEWQPDAPQAEKLLADRVHQPYPCADVEEAGATLWSREYPGAARVEIPRNRWRFARAGRTPGTAAHPDDTHVWLEGGFQPGVIYDLVYTTRICPVVGTGMLALRDAPSFLRYAAAAAGNPAAGSIRHVFGFGASQCGRLLRNFLYCGLNADEAGRQVYDGLFVHVAGARRGEFNHRYAQPSVITIPSFGFLPPVDFEGLLHRQRERGSVPRIFAVNTSAEYWNREASLLHTDAAGTRDLEPPQDVRIYHLAGTKHGPGAVKTGEGEETPSPPGPGGARPNVIDFKPALRAMLFMLERWVVDGTPPPPNAHPRIADGTAAAPADVLAACRRLLLGVPVPDPERLYWRRDLDLGPDAEKGIGRYPPHEHGEPYRWLVSALDGDGNERSGIRLPDVSVPVATHSGWFARRAGTGGERQNTDMVGTTVPFARDAAARNRRDDARPSIAERYRDRDDYAARARDAAHQLVAEGYLLPDDLELVVQNALDRYDAFCRTMD